MSPSRTVRLVAEREIRQRLRSKLFVLSTVAISVLLTAAAFIPLATGLFGGDDDGAPTEPEPVAIGVVGGLSPTGEDALDVVLPTAELVALDDEAAAVSALEAGDVELVVVDGARILRPASSGIFDPSAGRASQVAAALGTAVALEGAGAGDDVSDVLAAPPLEVVSIGEEDAAEFGARLIVANLGVVFLFGVLIMYSSMIINGVIEEKGSRVVELLVAAVPVPQLMAGKLLGLGIVGLLQTVVLFSPATIVLVVTAGDLVPPGVGAVVGLIVLWFILGYALYAVIAAGLGSLVSRPEEAQAVLTPANLLMIAGYFVGFIAIQSPDGLLARVAALVPFSAPYVMLVRQAIGSPTLLEVVVSIALMLATIVAMTYLAARIYRGGILRVGARVRLGEAWRGVGT